MKTLVALLVACCTVGVVQARPLQLEEKARITNPDPAFETFAGAVAMDGDEAFITGRHDVLGDPDDPFDDFVQTVVYLYRRVSGVWTPVRVMAQSRSSPWPYGVAMKGGVAAFAISGLPIAEKLNGDWALAQSTYTAGDEPGGHVAVDGGRVFYGGTSGTFKGTLIQKNSSTGVWGVTATMPGEFRYGDDEFYGRDVDLSGNRAVVYSPYSDEPPMQPTPNVAIFLNFGGTTGWAYNAGISSTSATPFEQDLEMRGDEIFFSGNDLTGTHVFRRQATGDWPKVDRLRPLTSHQGGGRTFAMHKGDLFIAQQNSNFDRDAGVINVFAKASNGFYDHVATLVASNGASLGDFAISGRNVIARCGDEACYFELPASLAQPARVQETFPGSTPTGWTLSSGSQFSIVQSGASRVLRQAETVSAATHTAILTASNWTNQAIQADIRPTAFNGNDRWVGLAAHYRDANNFYYVTLRSSGSVALKKIVNGVFSNIASAPLDVSINRTYRVRLESVGKRQRVYVNGVPMLDADDAAIPERARLAADLSAQRQLRQCDRRVRQRPASTACRKQLRHQATTDVWTRTGSGQWVTTVSDLPNTLRYVQTSVAGDARATVGVVTDDQSVDVRARATTFAGGSGDRWFGAIARYSNATNYYYFTAAQQQHAFASQGDQWPDHRPAISGAAGGTGTVVPAAPGCGRLAIARLRQWHPVARGNRYDPCTRADRHRDIPHRRRIRRLPGHPALTRTAPREAT
jgi:hypothetical protein